MKRKPGYRARNLDQLKKWVAGESVHNTVDDECVPDFSCCHPQLKVDSETRKYYCTTTDAKRRLLVGFIERLVEVADCSAVILAAAGEGTCEECGAREELRPYGNGGKRICFDCGMKDEAETERQFRKRL